MRYIFDRRKPFVRAPIIGPDSLNEKVKAKTGKN
jgi:hypothetical protein